MQGAGFRVQGSGFRVQGSGCRMQGAGSGVDAQRRGNRGGGERTAARTTADSPPEATPTPDPGYGSVDVTQLVGWSVGKQLVHW